MKKSMSRVAALSVCAWFALGGVSASAAVLPDHEEFEATLEVPFAHAGKDARNFKLNFEYPGAKDGFAVAWRLELIAPNGQVVQTWNGEEQLYGKEKSVVVPWAGRAAKSKQEDGFYTVRLTATSGDPKLLNTGGFGSLEWRVTEALANTTEEIIEQEWQIKVGNPPAPVMPEFKPLPRGLKQEKAQGATASLPYTVYFGNFHAQTNDSDGGGAIATCSSSQAAQSGAHGPADSYPYAKGRGLDFLLNSEHNHYFDGSSGTNTSAVPSVGINRYHAGITTANNFNAANPGFLAMYGMEWGVISNGGHMNIINGNLLAAWELNASNQLLGEILTPKSDYASIYATMAANNWIGQFNHPASTGQFIIGTTPLAYDANGENVMVLAEVMNTSAFSNNTTETETSRSTYEGAFNTLLERGFRVAPATNQDNHCANWGASYTNRTGVLIPTGTAISNASMDAALRARRVFATMDKNSQIILTANGHVMGEKFSNSGPLNLTVNFANTAGRTASSVSIFNGVPKRNGTVTTLATTATHSFTPANGEHFFYAKITQDDGKILWSAPIWVTQTAGGGDTTPPTVSASVTGTSGSITLNATASDNVGVTNVEFFIDGVSRGSDTTSPYSMAFDSTTLSNGTHSLTARASDAAGNQTTSTAASFSVNNPVPDTTPPTVSASVTGTSGSITLNATASDNVGVTNVEFFIDGVSRGSDTTSPYSMAFNSTALTNGTHSLTARASDAAGNQTTSTAVSFSINNPVPDTTPPTVSASESGTSGTITLSATASDNVGVTSVEFFIDGVSRGTDTTSPYSMTFNSTTLSNGTHSLTARASDAAGNQTTSAAVSFSINNPVPDTTPPTVSASESGTSGTITLSATASDNVGVTSVEFFIDGVSRGTDTTSPYSMTFNSTALTNGTHSLTARASDAAGNQTTSAAVSFSINNVVTTERIVNGGFESGGTSWTASSGAITSSASMPAFQGSWKLWLNGFGSANTEFGYQTITIPSTVTSATLSFYLDVVTNETTTTTAWDTLKVQVRNSSNAVLATLATYSNLNGPGGYSQKSFNIAAYKGQTIRVYFEGIEGSSVATSFLVDNVSVLTQ